MDLTTLSYFDLPQFIRERREALGLSLEEASKRMEVVSPETLQSWESGEVDVPLTRLQHLAMGLVFNPNLLILLVLSRTMTSLEQIFETKIETQLLDADDPMGHFRSIVDGNMRKLPE
jgi:transcriptional regulator with XRE-family HTH domain